MSEMAPESRIRRNDSLQERERLVHLRDMSLDGERLARLETKVDLILEHQEAFRRSFERHDDRLKHLENAKSGVLAIAATLGAVSAFVMDTVKHAFIPR